MHKFLTILTAFAPAAAFAQAAAPADASMSSQYASFLPLILIFGIFYVLLIRPQQKRMKEHQMLLSELKKGDEVVTGGGIFGKITKVDGDKVTVEIAKGVEVSVLKATVSSVVGKIVATPATAKKSADKKKNDNTALSRDSVANDN